MAIREDGTVVFEGKEQEELNRIVQERLDREHKKYADYEDIKGITEELKAFGYEGTPSEIRQAIRQQREEAQKQVDALEDKQDSGERLTQAEKDLLKKASEFVEKAEKQEQEIKNKKTQEEAWQNQVNEMSEAYPDVDLDQLANNTKFAKFVKGKALPLKELYEDFVEFIGEAESEAIKKTMSKASRSTSVGKESNAGGNYGLTASQMATVDDYNRGLPKRAQMTYQEFAQSLRK